MERFVRVALLLAIVLACFGLAEFIGWLSGIEPISETKPEPSMLRNNVRWGDARSRCAPEKVAAPDKKLILVFGGSTVVGYPHGVPFPVRLAGLLRGQGFAVANLGHGGKDSIYIRQCVERAIVADPWALVIYSGHNDFGNWEFIGYAGSVKMNIFLEEHAWIYDLRDILDRSRGFTGLVHLVRRLTPSRAAVSVQDLVERIGDNRRIILDKYADNINAVIDLAERRGAHVILVTVVSNLHEFPKETSALPKEEPFRTHLLAGRRLFRSERFAEARREFKLARDANLTGRAPSALNDRLRELSRGKPHVHLVDFEEELDRAGLEVGIGCNFFGDATYCDQFHPNKRTHTMMAKSVHRVVQGLANR